MCGHNLIYALNISLLVVVVLGLVVVVVVVDRHLAGFEAWPLK